VEKYNVLYTELSKSVGSIPWNEYPRPQLVRDSFYCLNGKWEFCVSSAGKAPTEYTDSIILPFSPESALSGVGKVFPDGSYYHYRRSFVMPEGFVKNRVILNFGAVEQECTVYINGKTAGTHTGGYTSFSLDVTELIAEGENELVVSAYDKLEGNVMPYGKQSLKRGGMWYTPVSGIWQTVWLESVPEAYVKELSVKTENSSVCITVNTSKNAKGSVTVHTGEGDIYTVLEDGTASFTVNSPRYWSPEDPYLYYYTVNYGEDTVNSYFGLRDITIEEKDGVPRMYLNGKPYFYNGLLDQGYWSDGLFLPATPKGYAEDINTAKELGYNMLRKHIKIEPEQFYYQCDLLGMAVFQDMVNNGKYSFFFDTALPTVGIKSKLAFWMHRNKAQQKIFEETMLNTVEQLKNHPCIVLWTVFNEGWGQFKAEEMYLKLRKADSTRMIDTASGWYKTKSNDTVSLHVYFKKFRCPKGAKAPVYLSEFGGYSFKPEGHVFNEKDTYGYRMFSDREKYADAVEALYKNEIVPAVEKGLSACVYTQLSDVEDETNGVVTYDRKIVKLRGSEMRNIAKSITEQLPR